MHGFQKGQSTTEFLLIAVGLLAVLWRPVMHELLPALQRFYTHIVYPVSLP